MRLLLVVTVVTLCFASGFGAPAEVKDEKKVAEEKKVEEKAEVKSEDKLEKREGKSLKQGNIYLANNEHKNAHAPTYTDPYQPAYGALTSDPLETAIGYVYYYLPTAENYLPKYETVKKFSPLVKRAMPIMKRMYDEASERVSGWSTSLVAAFAGLATSAGVMAAAFTGRHKRDLSNEIDGTNEVAPLFLEQETMMKIAREVDKYLIMYIRAFAEPECMEKFFCESGDVTGRLGGTVIRPILKLVEPLLPSYLRSYTDAFKQGFKDRAACSRSSCSIDSFF